MLLNRQQSILSDSVCLLDVPHWYTRVEHTKYTRALTHMHQTDCNLCRRPTYQKKKVPDWSSSDYTTSPPLVKFAHL